MIKKEYKYSELTGKIIGCAMEVHKLLGNGFQEVIYQRALEKEMTMQGLEFSREHDMPIFYKGDRIGTRRVDFLVYKVVSVEIKALTKIEDVHLAQAKNYVVAYDFPLGLLINFGSQSLQYKLIFNPKYNHIPKTSESEFAELIRICRINQNLQNLRIDRMNQK